MSVLTLDSLAYSAKCMVAAIAALGISLAIGLPMPFWAMTTAYLISSPLSGATRSKAIYRFLGTLIGAAVAVALVPMLVGWPELLSIALALWVGGCLAVSLLDRSPRSYVLMLAGYTATLIAFPSVERPEAIFDLAAARVTEIGLGIACSTVVHSVFWPRSVADVLGPRLRSWLADARTWRDDIVTGVRPPATDHDRHRLASDAVECALLATHVPFDTSHWREASGTVQALLRRMLLLLPLLSGLGDRRAALENAEGAWSGLLQESYDVRAAESAAALDECDRLLDHLDHLEGPSPLPAGELGRGIKLHADPGMALLSGASAALSIGLCCIIWIATGWADGATAAAMIGIFCCLFAALDNPVPAILRFGAAIIAGIPLAAVYLFAILPAIDGFVPLALVLSVPLLVIGLFVSHPRHAQPAVAMVMGFCSAMAIQETYSADFARFLNTNLGQIVAVVLAAGVTAGLRTIGSEAAITRLNRRLMNAIAGLASARTPPDRDATLSRATDRLALISERLGSDSGPAETGLREVRIALNVVSIQHLRFAADRRLGLALARVLRDLARWFGAHAKGEPPDRLLGRLDAALRLTLGGEPAGEATRAEGRAALVALRRNLFPQALPFVPEPGR
ncbi:FUSC family protein [Novosphingobium sp. KCTC 2891]|uniref:FUSC family protein n=1 Tax=Novosphingobium sp. KCTC 2891 TaxID=2989730 RepID=UPI00222197C7|nr:FUSC family protein [Novosphingobium sp. KCTC 2891]MCW1383572.1 FUSC family protein [Novosphingobium sp. KCTC 2891]